MNYLLYFCLIINDNCIFFSDKTAKSTLNELLVNVIETELANLYKSTESVEQLNENFLKENANNYFCVIEAAKLIYNLNPDTNQKRALDLVTDLTNKNYSKETFNLKTLCQVVTLLEEKEYFGIFFILFYED